MKGLEIFDTLETESRAELIGTYSSGEGFSLAKWRNGIDHVSYSGAGHHTFSVYNSGYGNAVRTDKNLRGIDDSFCLMPAGKGSVWNLEGPISFIHLYFTDRTISRIAERVFDKSGAGWSVPEITYERDKQLMLLSQWLLHSPVGVMTENPMLVEQNFSTIMTYLVGKLFRQDLKLDYRGGLSLHNARLVSEYIQEALDRPILLRELAELAGLSEFHFQRMFSRSFGISPHEYISRSRIDRAKELIRAGRSLAETAMETGFSSQQHFSRVFKQHTGITPGSYRKTSRF